MSKVMIIEGCYVDELHGVYAPMEACKVARGFGWSGRQPTDIEDSWYQEEEATEWLNDNVADDDHSFGWYNGGFYYFSNKWWEDLG